MLCVAIDTGKARESEWSAVESKGVHFATHRVLCVVSNVCHLSTPGDRTLDDASVVSNVCHLSLLV